MSEEQEIEETTQRDSLENVDHGSGIMPIGEQIYDNEWVSFLNRLSNDETLSDLVSYLVYSTLTERAKRKLQIYISTLLDREFSISRIADNKDYARLMADKALIDADLPLGLTRFDVTPEFQHIVNLLNIKFAIKTRRSMGGFERKIIPTARTETVNEDHYKESERRERSTGISNRIRDMFR